MKQRLFKVLLSISAMSVGGMIYILWRPHSLVMFAWFDGFGLTDHLANTRMRASPYSATFPGWFYYSLPQALWLFSGVLGFDCVWGEDSKTVSCRAWILAFVVISLTLELGQYVNIVPGHFDFADVVLLVFACVTAMICLSSRFLQGRSSS
jgi:hypothetical protein